MTNSNRSKDSIQAAMDNARASLGIEGLKVKDEYEKLVRSKLLGEITHEEFIEKAKLLSVK